MYEIYVCSYIGILKCLVEFDIELIGKNILNIVYNEIAYSRQTVPDASC